jgi:hypothetical protein
MNIFDAIRWLQDKPEGTELASKELRLWKKNNMIVLDGGYFLTTSGLLPLEHADFQPVVDWSKVAVDTKVLVSDFNDSRGVRRHFVKYHPNETFPFECYVDGMTSWTTEVDFIRMKTQFWKYCKLAEVENGST